MPRLVVSPKTRVYGCVACAAILAGPAFMWRKAAIEARTEAVANFKLGYSMPDGWVERQHSPQALFLYMDPKTKVSIRGAASQVIAEFNPTPELDRDGLTKQFAEVTVDNLGWKAEILDTVDFKGGSYRLIRRETVDRTIVTGIAVKGNTTILITLSGIGEARHKIDQHMPGFRDYLASTSLTKTVME
jgi:hypothetical protein